MCARAARIAHLGRRIGRDRSIWTAMQRCPGCSETSHAPSLLSRWPHVIMAPGLAGIAPRRCLDKDATGASHRRTRQLGHLIRPRRERWRLDRRYGVAAIGASVAEGGTPSTTGGRAWAMARCSQELTRMHRLWSTQWHARRAGGVGDVGVAAGSSRSSGVGWRACRVVRMSGWCSMSSTIRWRARRTCGRCRWCRTRSGSNSTATCSGRRTSTSSTTSSYRDRLGLITANATTPYILNFIELAETGPLVIELPAGPTAGGVSDFWQREIGVLGEMGPDAGRGGKHLVVPPGQEPPADVDGYNVLRSSGMNIMFGFRTLDPDQERSQALVEAVRIYPFDRARRPAGHADRSLPTDGRGPATSRGASSTGSACTTSTSPRSSTNAIASTWRCSNSSASRWDDRSSPTTDCRDPDPGERSR